MITFQKKYLDNTVAYEKLFLIRNELHIKFINGSTCEYLYCENEDGPMLVEINGIEDELPEDSDPIIDNPEFIEEISSILTSLDIDPSHSTSLLSLMHDMMMEIVRGWQS